MQTLLFFRGFFFFKILTSLESFKKGQQNLRIKQLCLGNV